MHTLFRLFSLIFLLVCAKPLYALNITTSIRPLGLLILELTEGTPASVNVLIPANQSSHDFSLRPKDIIGLNQADLIVWVGPELENFLDKPIHALSENKPGTVLTLLSVPTIKNQLLSLRSGPQWHDSHHHEHDHEHDHDHGHADHQHYLDPHIWLSPKLNLEIAKQVTKKLIALNPAGAKHYFDNFQRVANQLLNIDKAYRKAFEANPHRYLVLHDSYHYLEKEYGLKVSGVLTIDSERPSSIKMLREAQQNIATNQVTCLLGEPPFQPKLIQVLLEGQSEAKPQFVQLAPLADNVTLQVGNYEIWHRQMLKNIELCQ